MTYAPSPEGRIGRKEQKTRTPGREDTRPGEPASPAEESNASRATGGPSCTVRRAGGGGGELQPERQTQLSSWSPCLSDALAHFRSQTPPRCHACHLSVQIYGSSQGVGSGGRIPEKLRTDSLACVNDWRKEMRNRRVQLRTSSEQIQEGKLSLFPHQLSFFLLKCVRNSPMGRRMEQARVDNLGAAWES